jgi:outer membrane protein W
MVKSFSQLRFCAMAIGIALAMCALLFTGLPDSAIAEWYVGGYGGYSASGTLNNVTMPNYGQTLAFQRYNFIPNNPQGDQLTQSFNTSSVSLKSAPLFGGKVGYFFSDQGFSWLGLELEAFTSKPSIKSQTLGTTQSITFIKGTPGQPPCFPPPVANCSMQETINSQLTLSESSVRLITVAFNVVARYPGKVFQPYVGVGVGAFYFDSSGQISGRQVVPGLNSQVGLKLLATEEWGFFIEGKYNYAQITNLDNAFGLTGDYSVFSALAGIAYHF